MHPRPAQIPALTGVRLVAALWVVGYHILFFNQGAFPGLDLLLRHGDLGVDLFFLLSGFVLAHNHLDLGVRPSWAGAAQFVWLRFARIWPLYILAILFGGALLRLREVWFGSTPNVPLTWDQFLEQVFMVQQWHVDLVPDTSWTGPAWSISAEWLAYLCFPVLALLAVHLVRRGGRVLALALAGCLLVPLVAWVAHEGSVFAPWLWLGRIGLEFSCGVLLRAGLGSGSERVRRAATLSAPALLAATCATFALSDDVGRVVLLALLPVVLVWLAYGDGPVHRFLGHRWLLLGGGASYALYLVHIPLIKLFRDVYDHTNWIPLAPEQRAYGEVLVALVSLALAIVLHTRFEEPARRLLTRRTRPVEAEPDPKVLESANV